MEERRLRTAEEQRPRTSWETQAYEHHRRYRAAEDAYRTTCFALLRLCFRSASAAQIQKAAEIMRVARIEMEARQ